MSKCSVPIFFLALSLSTDPVCAFTLKDLSEIQLIKEDAEKLNAYQNLNLNKVDNIAALQKYYLDYSRVLQEIGEIEQAKDLVKSQIGGRSEQYSDEILASFYKRLADIEFSNADYSKARETIKLAIATYKKLDNIAKLTDSITRQGNIEARSGDYLKGLSIVKQFQKQYEQRLTQQCLIKIYNFYGNTYDYLHNEQQALTYKIKKLEIQQALGEPEQNTVHTLYAIAYSLLNMNRFNESYERFAQTLKIDRKYGNKKDIAHTLSQISYVSYELGKYDLSIAYAQEAIQLFKSVKHERNQAWTKHNMALSYAGLGNVKKAMELEIENSVFFSNTEGDLQIKTSVWNHLADLYLEQQNPQKAIELATLALNYGDPQAIGSNRLNSLNILHEAYKSIGDYQQAYEFQNQFLKKQTEYHEKNYSKKLAELQNTIEVKEGEQKLIEKEKENLAIKNALELEKTYKIVVVLLLLVFLSISVIIFIKVRQKRLFEIQKTQHLNKLINQRNQLFSQIAHDLSNPVTVANLHIEAMQHGIIECAPQNLNKISEKLKDLNHLVVDLAGLAKLETANFTLNTTDVSLNKFIDEINDEISAQQTEQQTSVRHDALLTQSVKFDPIRIKQVIANLYSNSRKYTHEDGKIDLCFSSDPEHFKIIIEDSAPSVPQEHIDNIFDHLFRVPNMSNTEISGHGIGLSIVKQIVELHQGAIRASQSSLGGLRIEVDLPTN